MISQHGRNRRSITNRRNHFNKYTVYGVICFIALSSRTLWYLPLPAYDTGIEEVVSPMKTPGDSSSQSKEESEAISRPSGHGQRTISTIDKDYPSAETIQAILKEDRKLITSAGPAVIDDDDDVELSKFARVYELSYALIAAFQRNDIPIFLGYGSHMGARRHHSIIPFGEKDVDFQVFCTDANRVKSIIRETLDSKTSWSTVKLLNSDFGFQLGLGISHYIDVWLFDDKQRDSFYRKVVKCLGWHGENASGCETWYKIHFRRLRLQVVPVFKRQDYFPPSYQVFGTHKVPIPAKSTELETFQYTGHWNKTCGMKKNANVCHRLYDKYPFVFKVGDGLEELRQGGVVIHRSNLLKD